MIELSPDDLIGKGRTRFCYRHPGDPEKCIKIDKQKVRGATAKEAIYYQKLERIRPNLRFAHIPRFYGFVETNLGHGGVFDLIRNETDGEIAKSLTYYLRTLEVNPDNPVWREAHQNYMTTLYQEAVVIRDFNPGNLCARQMRDGSYQLVSIDGIGHRDFIPLCDYFPWFARCKLRRHLRLKNFSSLDEIIDRLARKRALSATNPSLE